MVLTHPLITCFGYSLDSYQQNTLTALHLYRAIHCSQRLWKEIALNQGGLYLQWDFKREDSHYSCSQKLVFSIQNNGSHPGFSKRITGKALKTHCSPNYTHQNNSIKAPSFGPENSQIPPVFRKSGLLRSHVPKYEKSTEFQ